MAVVPFPKLVKPHLTRLASEIEAVIDAATLRDELTPIEIMGALEWAKHQIFYSTDDA